MELLFYLGKSGAILALFYLVYAIVLRKDTLFNANRHYLMAGILASVLFPLIQFTKTIYIEAPIAVPFLLSESLPETQYLAQESSLFDWWQIALLIYAVGVFYMLFRFLGQIYSLLLLLKKYPSEKVGNYTYVKVPHNSAPFSFFKHIVFNPEVHAQEELMMILKHEQIHGAQWHSIDIIVANLLLIFQWMNPLAWLYKKGIEENLEFIADSATVQQVTSIKKYQLALVKASSTFPIPALTNNFYQSFIKKRILMLNKSNSNKFNIWKLSIILPLLAIFLWSFNVNEVTKYTENDAASGANLEVIKPASEKEKDVLEDPSEAIKTVLTMSSKTFDTEEIIEPQREEKIITHNMKKQPNAQDVLLTITKDTTKEELDAMKSELSQMGFSFEYSNVNFNKNREIIGISINYEDANGNSGNYNVNSDSPINTIVIKSDGKSISVRSGGSGPYSYSNDEEETVVEERRNEMKKRREEMKGRMEERREEMKEEMEIKRTVTREDMDEERHETILEMREERKSARDKMRKERGLLKSNDEHSIHELHITDTNDLLHHYRTDRDSSRHLFDEKRTEIHKRQQHRRSSFPMENLKSISKEDSNADLDRIVDEYKSEGISFSYSGLKRNSKGEIIKIKLRLNNNNGSNSQSHYDGDGEAIKTIYVGSDGQTTIMTTKK